MIIPRSLLSALQTLQSKYPVLALTGPRQSGKTTLLQTFFKDYRYVSLENPDIRERAQEDPRSFLEKYHERVILDEVQRVPELFSYLQTKVDQDKKMGQYILSGSQNFLLLETITQSLAGRVALFNLLPFSFAELKQAGLMTENWQQACFKGFYPAIYDRDLAPDVFYPNYIETYLERDVRNLINVKNLRQFRLFLKLCAGNAGQRLNVQSLARDCGISSPTAKAWLSVLESSFIIFTLSPFYRNFNKRVIKSPKLYFYDTGLICNLLEMREPEDVSRYFQRGSLFENLIIAEAHKSVLHQGRRPSFYLWQDNHGNEVDLLWEEGGKVHLVEVKSGKTVARDFFKNLRALDKIMGPQAGEQFLIYGGEENYTQNEVGVYGWQDINSLLNTGK